MPKCIKREYNSFGMMQTKAEVKKPVFPKSTFIRATMVWKDAVCDKAVCTRSA